VHGPAGRTGLGQAGRGWPRACCVPRRRPPGRVLIESCLEGGVNRANLKFINLSTTTSRVTVRNINESEREGEKQIVSK
jgi:hypothetical protein